MSSLPSGTVTFLFTDIEGSTALLRELGDRYADVLAQERSILRERLTEAGGQEIDTQGDAFFFSFTRARDAVAGAVAAQRALAEHGWPDGVDVKVRMGLHTGEPSVGDEGYVGLDVVRAARICSAGHGGQILLSETTRALLGGTLPDGAALNDLGLQTLKDVGEERVYQLSIDGRDDFAPLKAERTLRPSKADILGDDFEQRVEAFVRRSINDSFASGKPQEKAKGFWSRFSRRG
ncbi:MAG TPA: adenylate/guanylate cyclase domain-containing protein [Gaiellaceae bacterium]|nr:adenylate/guanylate cyclase domain-containing protein [Gaiellaceae bacterium]